MSFALLVLVLLISATPLTIIFDDLAVQGLIAVLAALSSAIVALRIRPGEASFLSSVIRPFAIVAALPAVWMLFQIVPLQTAGLVHPIWKSASAALGQPMTGSISVDPGGTIISFITYLSAVAIAFVSVAVAIDRRRAEWVLLALMAATTFSALIALAGSFEIFALPGFKDGGRSNPVATTAASLGVIFAIAATLHVSQRGDGRRIDQLHSSSWLNFGASFSALAICSVAVLTDESSQIYFSVVYGVAITAVVIAIRRFSLGPWGIAAIASTILFILLAVFALQLGGSTVGLTTAFASQATTQMLAVTQRILSDANWAGTGAGTFSAILPIYQEIGESTTGQLAPTAAAAIAIEMGRPFFFVLLIGVLALVFVLMRGALRRQRDSFYSAAGASCTVTTALLSFSNAALLSTPTMIVVAAAIGMAIAQSKSRLV